MRRGVVVVTFADGQVTTVSHGLGVLEAVYLKYECNVEVKDNSVLCLETGKLLATLEER